MNAYRGKKMNSKLIIFSVPIFLIAGLIILFFVSFSYLKIYFQKAAINKEIDNFKREKEKLEADNTYLTSIIDYFASESYKEREMRLKLGMQKPGEKVIIISREKDRTKAENLSSENNNDSKFSNLRKWWNYFFGK